MIGMQRPQDQRSRSAKPTTIHGYAQSGDLLAIQRLLRDNPSLLNERNPVVRSPSLFFFFFLLHGLVFLKGYLLVLFDGL